MFVDARTFGYFHRFALPLHRRTFGDGSAKGKQASAVPDSFAQLSHPHTVLFRLLYSAHPTDVAAVEQAAHLHDISECYKLTDWRAPDD
jgi:hypothetical protein